MKETRHSYKWVAAKLGALVVLLLFAIPCFAARPTYVPRRLIVTLTPGSTVSDAQALARTYKMSVVKPLPVANTFLMQCNKPESVPVKLNQVKANRKVQSASPNYYLQLLDVPDDPLYPMQWHYDTIKMPQAWGMQKGKDGIIVAVIDNGISLDHPDIAARLVPGTDLANGDGDPQYVLDDTAGGHGLHVAGTIAAVTNNNVGVAGVCWSGIKIMPINVFPDGQIITDMAIAIEGMDYAKIHGANVVNMSLGTLPEFGFIPALQAKVNELVNAGIVVVASAGNDGAAVVDYPAACDGAIGVSAVDRNGLLTNYSNYGPQISVAAPGGDYSAVDGTSAILSLSWTSIGGNSYAYSAGTSMACPQVAGAAALLLSNGCDPADVKRRLQKSAIQAEGLATPNDKYGWGVVDVFGALCIEGGVAKVIKPSNGQRLDTQLPRFTLKFVNPANTNKDAIEVYVGSNVDADNDGIPDDATRPIINSENIDGYYNSTTGIIDFQPVLRDPLAPTQSIAYPVEARNPLLVDEDASPAWPLAAGVYRIAIKALPQFGATDPIISWSTFRVQPRQQPAGLTLASVPYPLIKQSNDARIATQMFYGTNSFKMARWIPGLTVYARLNYPGVINDSKGSLFPPDVDAHPETAASATPPAGTGFWLYLTSPTDLIADTFVDDVHAYEIPVVAGWNMIGDPFPFKVDWNSVMASYKGRTLTISDAVASGWIRPALYRYTPSGYTYQSLPGGVLIPWEGNWVRALKGTPAEPFVDANANGVYDEGELFTDQNLNQVWDAAEPVILSVPPVPSQVVTNSSVRSDPFRLISSGDAQNGWSIRLAVGASSVRSCDQTIGVSADASDAYDALDVEAPPSPPGFAKLVFAHHDWGQNSGSYSTDMRSPLGAIKAWKFEVTTDQRNTDVRIAWGDLEAVPQDCLLTLVDCESGKKVSLRTASSYVYHSGARPKPRHFKLYAKPANSIRLATDALPKSYRTAANR